MPVSMQQVQDGAVFKFKTADRRVTGFGERMRNGFDVHWEYADGKKRSGRLGGSMWIHYFIREAIEEVGVSRPAPAFTGKFQAYLPFDPATNTPYLNAVGSSSAEAEANLSLIEVPDEAIPRIQLIKVDITPSIS